MEKSRRIANALLKSPKLSKTQEKKHKGRKHPNVFFKKELTALSDTIDDPRTQDEATFQGQEKSKFNVFYRRQNLEK